MENNIFGCLCIMCIQTKLEFTMHFVHNPKQKKFIAMVKSAEGGSQEMVVMGS